MRRIRLLFILDSLRFGGAQKAVLALLRHLDRTRFEPTLLLLKEEGMFLDELPAGATNHSAVLPAGVGRLRRHLPYLIREVSRRARDCDVIIGGQEFNDTYLAALVGALARKPVVGCVHTLYDSSTLFPSATLWQRFAVRFCYSKLSHVVVISPGAAAHLQELLRVPPANVSVMPNTIDSAELRAKAAAPLPPWAGPIFAKPVVLGAGRLADEKAFEVLIHTHAKLKASSIDHHLLILGEGPRRAELEELCRRLAVVDSVFMPGALSNPYPFFRASRVLAHPARYEMFGLVIAEAMALRLPVVAVDCPTGPSELLERGRHGTLVAPGDEAGLANSVLRLLTDPALRASYVESGQRRAADFGVAQTLPKWEALFSRLAAGAAIAKRRPPGDEVGW